MTGLIAAASQGIKVERREGNMKKLALNNTGPALFECDIDRILTEMPDYYLPAAPGVLVAGADMLYAAGDFPGAPAPAGWARRASGWMKPSRDNSRTLWVQPCGRYWIIERSPVDVSAHDETLVFAFVLLPIWTRTMASAMRLAEHCDPIPQSPVAGYWARVG